MTYTNSKHIQLVVVGQCQTARDILQARVIEYQEKDYSITGHFKDVEIIEMDGAVFRSIKVNMKRNN